MPSVLDLRVDHDRFGSSSDPSINGHLHHPNDVDRSLNDDVTDKIRQYRADYNNRPSNTISFIPAITSTSGRKLTTFCHLQVIHFFLTLKLKRMYKSVKAMCVVMVIRYFG